MSSQALVELAGIVTCAAALAGAVVYFGMVRRSLPGTALDLPFGLVTVVLALGVGWSVDWQHSAWRLLVWCAYLATFYLALEIPKPWLLAGARWTGAAIMALCVAEVLVEGAGRVNWIANPNVTASWLLLLLPLGSDMNWSMLWLWWLFGVVQLLATGSRGALIGLLVVVGSNKRWIVIGAAVVAVAAVILVAWRPGTVDNRLRTWAEATRLYLQRPLTGWGPGAYPSLARNEPGHPHADSAFFTTAAETGLVGLVVMAWATFAAGRIVVRSTGMARFALVAWGVQQLVDNTFWWYGVGLAVMIALALTVGDTKKTESLLSDSVSGRFAILCKTMAAYTAACKHRNGEQWQDW